jgi:hypothetical protein
MKKKERLIKKFIGFEKKHWRGELSLIPIVIGTATAPQIAAAEGLPLVVGGTLGQAAVGAAAGTPVAFLWHESLSERYPSKRKLKKVI